MGCVGPCPGCLMGLTMCYDRVCLPVFLFLLSSEPCRVAVINFTLGLLEPASPLVPGSQINPTKVKALEKGRLL